MINYFKNMFCRDKKGTDYSYASLKYSEDFTTKLAEIFKLSGLRVGVYTCGSLTLEVSLTKYDPYFDCMVFDKDYNLIYHLVKEGLWVTGCRYHVADYQIDLAKSFLWRKWVKENEE